jgi:uncharacterized protein (TIGR03435 family)
VKRILAGITLTLILTGLILGQSAEPLPSFEAADVHPSPKVSNPQTAGGFARAGRYQFRNATMVDMIASAYGVEAEKVLGGPSWLEADRFDILAKVPASTSNDTAKLMLRSLLADRFKLVIRNEEQTMTVYALTQGKGKVLMKESEGGATGCQGVPQNPAPGTVPLQVVACRNMTMPAFATLLRQAAGAYVDNPVMDLTELKGGFDFEIKWTARGQLAAAGADGITLFDAVDKQLGLKLELEKRASPVLMVASVNRKPTDNIPGVEKLLPVVPTEFEVGDIKPTDPAFQGRQGNIQPGGRLDLRGGTLKDLIMLAWEIQSPDLVATPKWVETERFDVVAKAPADVSVAGTAVDVDTLRAMLRVLLIERFKMKFHTENRPINVYAMVTTRKEPRLKQADPASRSTCKRSVSTNAAGIPMASLTCQNTTMDLLAEKLPGMAPAYVDRPAVDLTKLEGGWDFVLNWTPRGAFDGGGAAGQPGAPADPNGTFSLFEGLERLGLKLEQQKQPVPVLVIDQLEQKPVEN